VGINTTSGNVSGILIDIGSNPIPAANQKPNNMKYNQRNALYLAIIVAIFLFGESVIEYLFSNI
jgi:hypothetical protein